MPSTTATAVSSSWTAKSHQHRQDQYNWLQAELSRPETQQAAFRIVCFHRPPYCNVWNGGGYIGEDLVRNDWVPLFTQKNVDIVIGGHSTPINAARPTA